MKKTEELKAKRQALLEEVDGATAERFAEIRAEVEKIEYQLRHEEARGTEEELAARDANGAKPAEGEKRGASGKVVLFDSAKGANGEMDEKTALRSAKSAVGKMLRAKISGLKANFSDNEKRAIGLAITTTATDYAAPGEGTDGVNNGGVFIPKTVMADLLDLDKLESPFLRDVAPTAIKGLLVFPYVSEETEHVKGRGKAETVAADSRTVEWKTLTPPIGRYPLTMAISLDLLTLTDEGLADALLADLSNEIDFILTDEVLYGTGSDNRIEGVTKGAIQGAEYAEGGEAEAIKAGLLALSRRARKGAKIYVSRSISLNLAFEKSETGGYLFPLYNNGGITSIATIPVEVDEGLKDGEFVIGNAKNYKLNVPEPMRVYPNVDGERGLLKYTARLIVAGQAAPKRFYYGKKSAGE